MAVLTTLILLSYAKLLHTIIAALSFATLEYPNGSRRTLWLPDATVGYLSGKHIALFIAAVFILLLGVVYTALLFSWQWLLRYQEKPILCWVRNQKLCQFLEPYHAPYTFGQRYWTGLLLLVRVVLYIVSAINMSGNPRVALVSTITLIGFLPLLKGFLAIRVYKKVPLDLLEMLVYFNLMILSAFSWYSLEANQLTRVAVAYTSTSIIFVLLVAVLFYHIYEYTNVLSKRLFSFNFRRITCLFQKKQPHNQAERDDNIQVDEVIEIRTKPTFSFVEVHKPEIQNLESEMNNRRSIPIQDAEIAVEDAHCTGTPQLVVQAVEQMSHPSPPSSELLKEKVLCGKPDDVGHKFYQYQSPIPQMLLIPMQTWTEQWHCTLFLLQKEVLLSK